MVVVIGLLLFGTGVTTEAKIIVKIQIIKE